MMCHFGQTRNGSVATDFIHFSNTATSSATNDYVAVLGRVSQNEEPASRNQEPNKNKPSSAPKMYLNDAHWNHKCIFVTCNHVFRLLFYYLILMN